MKKQMKGSSRVLSFVLALCLIAGMLPAMAPTAGALYHTDNAPAASAETLASTQDTFAATSYGGMLRIINGDLYVWGSNNGYGLGYEGLGGGYLESPKIHSHNAKFRENGASVKKIIASSYTGVTILTDANRIFSWGDVFYRYVFQAKDSSGKSFSSDNGQTPVEWVTTQLKADIEEVYSSSLAISVKTTDGNWYMAGSTGALTSLVDDPKSTEATTLKPISESFIDKLQPSYQDVEQEDGTTKKEVTNEAEKQGGEERTIIKKLIPSYGGHSTFIITEAPDGTEKLWAIGQNNHGQNLLPDLYEGSSPHSDYPYSTFQDPDTGKYWSSFGLRTSYPKEVLTANPDVFVENQNADLVNAKPELSTLNTSGINTTFIDAAGSVWMVGDLKAAFYDNSVNHRRPQKVYDGKNNGAKAVKVYQSDSVVVILTEDNSLYAIGSNQNNFISSANVTYVHDLHQQVFKSLSQSQTIAGVYPTNKGVMVVTESGEQFYAGDNSAGTAGNGTTESPTNGSYMESVAPTIPPVQPTSANQISFDIEDENGTRYASDIYIDPNDPDAEPVYRIKETDINGNVTYKAEDELSFTAGKKIKLNVYFEDFAKISQFFVPIAFDKASVKVINGSGIEYTTDRIVTPGAIGESVGITKGFTNETWQGGILTGELGIDGTYPKIANGEGWVAVHGYSPDSGRIKEKQLMFSIDFMVVGQASGESFWIYDEAKYNDLVVGAAWTVTPGANSTADPGVFDFSYYPSEDYFFPSYSATVEPLNSISLKIESSTGNKIEEVTESVTVAGTSETKKGYGISWANTDEVYTITVVPDPTYASFPQVTWTTPFTLVNDPNDGVTTAENYLTIVEQGPTYIKVKVPENVKKEAPGVIEIHATSVKDSTTGKKATAYIPIIVTTFDPPKSIAIAEKASLTNGTIIYTRTDDEKNATEIKTFHASFPDDAADTNFDNIQVTWKLLDKNRNELTDKNTSNPVELRSPTSGSGKPSDADNYEAPSVTVQPLKTTYGEDYVILRVESMYDPSIYDELIIKVQLEATKLSFSQPILRMPADTSKDLRPFLQISPADYYSVDLEWSFTPSDNGSFIIFNNSSVITAGSNPTNAVEPGESGSLVDVYDTVKVTDKISGEYATIDIEVLSLDSPIMPDDVNVVNILGPKGDYVEVKDGLEVGDIIRFYKTYDTPKPDETVSENEKNKVMREFEITEPAQTPRFNFTLNDFLDSGGGEIAMTVERDNKERNRVPLTYNPEPSKVYGYVRLSGKNANSALNEGIQVLLSDGVSTPDPVYTDKNGRFEFTTYIVPGSYTLTIYQDNYLKRVIKEDAAVGYAGLIIPTEAEFAISTAEDPILLYPGDVNADGAINTTDLNYYVRNWVGQTSTSLKDFAKFDFYDGSQQVVDLLDLDLVLRRLGWGRENYAKWYVPTQK